MKTRDCVPVLFLGLATVLLLAACGKEQEDSAAKKKPEEIPLTPVSAEIVGSKFEQVVNLQLQLLERFQTQDLGLLEPESVCAWVDQWRLQNRAAWTEACNAATDYFLEDPEKHLLQYASAQSLWHDAEQQILDAMDVWDGQVEERWGPTLRRYEAMMDEPDAVVEEHPEIPRPWSEGQRHQIRTVLSEFTCKATAKERSVTPGVPTLP